MSDRNTQQNKLPPVPGEPLDTQTGEQNTIKNNNKLSLSADEETAVSLFLDIQERPCRVDTDEALRVKNMADACAIYREEGTMEVKPNEPETLWYEVTYDHESRNLSLGICTSEADTRERLDDYAGWLRSNGWTYHGNCRNKNIFEQVWSVDPETDDIDGQINELVSDALLEAGGWLRHRLTD